MQSCSWKGPAVIPHSLILSRASRSRLQGRRVSKISLPPRQLWRNVSMVSQKCWPQQHKSWWKVAWIELCMLQLSNFQDLWGGLFAALKNFCQGILDSQIPMSALKVLAGHCSQRSLNVSRTFSIMKRPQKVGSGWKAEGAAECWCNGIMRESNDRWRGRRRQTRGRRMGVKCLP